MTCRRMPIYVSLPQLLSPFLSSSRMTSLLSLSLSLSLSILLLLSHSILKTTAEKNTGGRFTNVPWLANKKSNNLKYEACNGYWIVFSVFGVMGVILELITNLIIFGMKPLSLLKLLFMFGVRTAWLVASTWVNFHVEICSRVMIWTVAIVSLPMRILNAIHRERLLEVQLLEMQIEFENLAWDKKKLEERLRVAIQDRRIMDSILSEIEEEHDKAISRIELLEHEIRDLKEENLRLNEIQGKGFQDFRYHDDRRTGEAFMESKYGTPLLIEDDYGRVTTKEHLMHKNEGEGENRSGPIGMDEIFKMGTKSDDSFIAHPSKTGGLMVVDEAIDRRREVALSRSLFSSILSLLVGMIIWKAEDPCMPLVVALFSVVGMSLKSVVQFFSTVKNKPASDAVALLSFNWFILGTLTYPTLPKVAHLFAPFALRLATRTIYLLGLA